jgi:FixJ family two-component response regulator
MIFIVDDDESVRVSLVRLMRSVGFPAEAFAAAEDLLRKTPEGGCDCVIIDVHMAGMTGLELQQALIRRNEPPPIVMITAHDAPETRRKAIEAGAVAFITKPFDDLTLLRAISEAIGGKEE